MNNYIGKVDAEWVDPAVALPREGWRGMCRARGGAIHPCVFNSGTFYLSGTGIPSEYPYAWLRVGGPTDAVPRAQVQAAVDEMIEIIGEDCVRCDKDYHRRLCASCCAGVVSGFTGVSPSEVTP